MKTINNKTKHKSKSPKFKNNKQEIQQNPQLALWQ